MEQSTHSMTAMIYTTLDHKDGHQPSVVLLKGIDVLDA